MNGLLITESADDTVYNAELTNSDLLNMGSIVDSNITINNFIEEIKKYRR